MYVLGIIQARIGSERLPGKVLAQVNGRPLLWYVVRRAQLATRLDAVVVAIPEGEENAPIAEWCRTWNVPCYAGPEDDVLERFCQVAHLWTPHPSHIVRLTADCPLIDPAVIDAVVMLLASDAAKVVYASNVFPHRTFPDGLDVEAFPMTTLRALDTIAQDPADREHVTSYLHRRPKQFTAGGREIRSANLRPAMGDARWTVDVAEDLEFVRAVYEFFECPWDASMQEIIRRCRPQVVER